MGEIRLSDCCRLCLKEGFSLTNIFSQRSAAGDPFYQILNFINEMKIFENDGLPSHICSPRMWRMIEFVACKKNVRSAEADIMRLLSLTRIDEPSEVEVAIEHRPVKSEVSIKEEFDIVELEMPPETAIEVPEATQHVKEAEENNYNDIESDAVMSQKIDLELKMEELVIDQEEAIPTPGSSDVMNMLSLEASEEAVGSPFEGESICSTQGISAEIKDTNKGINVENLRDDVVPEEESLSSEMSKSILHVRKTGHSHLKAPLSKLKSEFICDICKKCFKRKLSLGTHVRVHYDERPFSCRKCDKSFKHDVVRHQHELRHLRDEINFGKCEKGTKKRLYSCVLCAMNFSSENGLWRHINMHTKKYKCNSCGKYFGDNGNLKTHLRTHTKEKPFECKVCLKCFNRKGNLNIHLLIHSSERPYVCDICDKRFKTKQSKNQHELCHLRKK